MSYRPTTRPARAAGMLFAAIAIVGCHVMAGEASDRGVTAAPAIADVLEKMTREVLTDAASRTGVPGAALVVERAEAVTWPDGALGCGKPGVMYTQAPVPGYRIVVRAGDERLSYHANRKGYWTYCPSPSIPDDSSDPSVTLSTISRAAAALGRNVRVQFAA